MTIRHFQIFVQTYRLQSITHAAEELHLAQPAVTRAIKEMEDYYGIRLFERMYHRILPTESGRKLYPQAIQLLNLFDRIETGLRDWDSLGKIRVGATVTLGDTVLPKLARRFQQENPGVELQAKVANGDTLATALCENELDLALMENAPARPDLVCEEIGSDSLCAVMAASSPLAQKEQLSLEELSGYPLLVRETGSTARTVLHNAFEAKGLDYHIVWESVSTQALLRAAAEELGVAILPEERVKEQMKAENVVVCSIMGQALKRQRVAVWHKQKYLTASMKRFLQLCRTQKLQGSEKICRM